MSYDFRNQVAMITGASGNLGSAVARAFKEAGAKLALIDRHEDMLRKEFPDLVEDVDCLMTGCADLTAPSEVGSVMEAAVEHFGKIDILVNTVGGYRAGAPIYETSLDTWDFMINLNARSVFITTKIVLEYMLRQGRGKIIHLAARPGLAGRANASAYSASKAAVIRITESAAAEVKSKGINVNCLLPGTIDTPANRQAMPEADYSRWVKPEIVAEVILFLASESARTLNGASIPV